MKKSFEIGLNKIAKAFEEEQLSYTNKMLIISSLLLFLILTCGFLVFYISELGIK